MWSLSRTTSLSVAEVTPVLVPNSATLVSLGLKQRHGGPWNSKSVSMIFLGGDQWLYELFILGSAY